MSVGLLIQEHDQCWETLMQLWRSKEVRHRLTSIHASAVEEARDEGTTTSVMVEPGEPLLARLVQQNGWDDQLNSQGVHCTKHVQVYVSAQKGF